MTARALSALSVLSHYVETGLQFYVLLSFYADNVLSFPVVLVALCLIATAFVGSNCASFFLELKFRGEPGNSSFRVLVVCGGLHVVQLGLAWRVIRLIHRYDKRNLFHLGILRLVHVSLQTFPYVIIVGRPLASGSVPPQPLAVSSLVVSLTSSAVALCAYALRHHLHESLLMDIVKLRTSKLRRYLGTFLLLTGTLLCLATRLAALVLMAAEYSFWACVLPSVHLAAFLTIHFLFLRRKMCQKWRRTPVWELVLAGVGLSYLQVFDLVEVGFRSLQCRYVAFYAAMLVENVVMMALWLLFSPVEYIAKLLVVVGLLVIFLCALVVKFTSCGLVADPQVRGNPVSDSADLASIFHRRSPSQEVGEAGDVIRHRQERSNNGFNFVNASSSSGQRSLSVVTISSHSGDCFSHRYHRRRPHHCRRHSDCRQGDTSHTTSTLVSDVATLSTSQGRSSGSRTDAARTNIVHSDTGPSNNGPYSNPMRCLLHGDSRNNLTEVVNTFFHSYTPRRFSSPSDGDHLDCCLFDDPLSASHVVTSFAESRRLRSSGSSVRNTSMSTHASVKRQRHKEVAAHAHEKTMVKVTRLPLGKENLATSTSSATRTAGLLDTNQAERCVVEKRRTEPGSQDNRVKARRFSCDAHRMRHRAWSSLRQSRSESLRNHKAPSPQFTWSTSSTLDSLQTSAEKFASSTSSSSSEESPYRWPSETRGAKESERAATWPRRKNPAPGTRDPDVILPREGLSALDAVRLWLDSVCDDVSLEVAEEGQARASGSAECAVVSSAFSTTSGQTSVPCPEAEERTRGSTRTKRQSYREKQGDLERAGKDRNGVTLRETSSTPFTGTLVFDCHFRSPCPSAADTFHTGEQLMSEGELGADMECGHVYERELQPKYKFLPFVQLDMCESLV